MFKGLLIIAVLYSASISAETLFYKKNGWNITSEEHMVLYNHMLETQVPMSVA